MSASFSTAEYDSLIQKIENGINTVISDANSAVSRIESWTSWIPFVGDAIKDALNKFVSLMDDFLKKIVEYLKFATIPPTMWGFGQQWVSMATKAGQSATELATLKQYSTEWEGIAGGKYNAAVTGQEPAVDTIQSRSNSISGSCSATAMAGFAFYASLAGILVGLTIACITAETGVGLVFGITTAAISLAGAVTSVTLGLWNQERSLEQASEPTDTMPGGAWPQATTA